MPPKKSKPKRTPHPNETPLKHKAPGHGAVERSKNNMWSTTSSESSCTASSAVVAKNRPKYKATSNSMAVGIGRGGIGRGGGGVTKKKAVEEKDKEVEEGERGGEREREVLHDTKCGVRTGTSN